MKSLEDIRASLQAEKEALVQKFKLKEIGIFGSIVRGERQAGSDVDILVDFYEAPGLLEFVGIEQELSELLGVEVDLVMKEGLKPRIGRRIL